MKENLDIFVFTFVLVITFIYFIISALIEFKRMENNKYDYNEKSDASNRYFSLISKFFKG
jgi:hypothetical protein